jgi:hypothetical protein
MVQLPPPDPAGAPIVRSGLAAGAYSVHLGGPVPLATVPPRIDLASLRTEVELTVVPAGTLRLGVEGDRFAEAGGVGTLRQRAFSAASTLRVEDGSGGDVLELRGLERGFPMEQFLLLPPGRYVVKLTAPGGEQRVEHVEVRGGESVSVVLRVE